MDLLCGDRLTAAGEAVCIPPTLHDMLLYLYMSAAWRLRREAACSL